MHPRKVDDHIISSLVIFFYFLFFISRLKKKKTLRTKIGLMLEAKYVFCGCDDFLGKGRYFRALSRTAGR